MSQPCRYPSNTQFGTMGSPFVSFARAVIDLPRAHLAKFQTRSKTTACSPPILQYKNGYWASVTFGTAARAIERDERIEKLMADLPAQSITVLLKTPSGRTYLLNDAEADGILDYARDVDKKTDHKKIDIRLLDRMQQKYTWIISLIKKHNKN